MWHRCLPASSHGRQACHPEAKRKQQSLVFGLHLRIINCLRVWETCCAGPIKKVMTLVKPFTVQRAGDMQGALEELTESSAKLCLCCPSFFFFFF